MYERFGKRLIDLIISVTLAIALAPVWLAVAFIIRWWLGSPILFSQARAGLNGEPFDVVKFRSMTNRTDNSGELLPDEQRLTRLGTFLRATSLDELPQLWNVIRGQMSLVGPRPLLLSYVARYDSNQKRRLQAVPGITGWAQVNGRNAISWEERFALDLWYVDHRSLTVDLKILFLTAWRLIVPKGISSRQHVTMPEFLGSERSATCKSEP